MHQGTCPVSSINFQVEDGGDYYFYYYSVSMYLVMQNDGERQPKSKCVLLESFSKTAWVGSGRACKQTAPPITNFDQQSYKSVNACQLHAATREGSPPSPPLRPGRGPTEL